MPRMSPPRSAALPSVGLLALVLLAAVTGAMSCANSSHPIAKNDGGAGSGGTDSGGVVDHPADAPGADGSTDRQTGTTLEGKACGAGNECASGFCFDGVCCKTDCSTKCWTCNAPGSAGTCIPAEVNTDPRSECADEGLASCGQDGMCDGIGACRRYPTGTICRQPMCNGSTLTQASLCAGGVCKPSTGLPCDPYVCDATGMSCFKTCTAGGGQCGAPNVCNTSTGSCGKRPVGSPCASPDDCNSNMCQQGICCSELCSGNCKSCAVPQREGTCTLVPAGQDPLGQCADNGATTCGTDGACDGKGGCEIYSSATTCQPSMCTGSTGTQAGKCNGAAPGSCQAGLPLDCKEYKCGTTGTCLTSCRDSNDCSAGNVCNGTICGKKTQGAICTANNECASGACAISGPQGVCCDNVCTAPCMACNVPLKVGTCSAIAAGPAPTGQCPATAAAACGNDGTCNGNGKCRLFATGTQCKPPSCAGSIQTLAGQCDGAGTCGAQTTQMCDPYQCVGMACLAACTVTGECTTGNVCTNMKCGKSPPGAACTGTADCASNLCEQGVCCLTTCQGTCKSCALAGTAGTCTNIGDGKPPVVASQCVDGGATACMRDGMCNGAGACRLYQAGTQCAPAKCAGSTFTPAATCTGAGVCSAVTGAACPGSYACDTTQNICKITCTTQADCAANVVCNVGVCSAKPLGQPCTVNSECASNSCQQGVCCSGSCAGGCTSCALPGKLGTCSNVAAGTAASVCATTAVLTCGTDGTCDGLGGCRRYPNGTVCVAGSCPAMTATLTPNRTCDGAGNCLNVTAGRCDPFLCGANAACKNSCTPATSAMDCLSPNVCNGTSCGLKPNGTACTTGGECNSTFCAQGFCCDKICNGTCQSCAIATKVGTCSLIAAGSPPTPATQCGNQGTASCGTDGTCDGSGACRFYATGTVCAPGTCGTVSTQTFPKSCTAANTCTAPAPATGPCVGGFQCNTTTSVCKTTCTVATSAADCASPNVCTGTICGVLKLQYQAGGVTAAMTNSPHPQFQIINLGATAVPLSELTIRYWYTGEGATSEVATVDDARNSANAEIHATMTSLFTGVNRVTADRYLQLGFTAASGSLNASGGTATVQSRFNSANFASYTQTNDYSFDATKTSFADWTKVTLYRLGTLVWGIEPASM